MRFKQSLLIGTSNLVACLFGRATAGTIQQRLLTFAGMRVQGPVFVASGLTVHKPRHVSLGARAFFSAGTRIVAYDRVEIGDDFICAEDLLINTGTHDPVTLTPSTAPVRIGARVWVGARVTILAGVTIGDDVVIGAGAVVVKNIPSGVIAAGVPCRVIRPLERPAGVVVWSASRNTQVT
jgi:acetyltransferase-like isoleucine patch superfamily enzyme